MLTKHKQGLKDKHKAQAAALQKKAAKRSKGRKVVVKKRKAKAKKK